MIDASSLPRLLAQGGKSEILRSRNQTRHPPHANTVWPGLVARKKDKTLGEIVGDRGTWWMENHLGCGEEAGRARGENAEEKVQCALGGDGKGSHKLYAG